MKNMLNDFMKYIEVYGIDNSSLEHDDYVTKFMKDMIDKNISDLTDNQKNFLKKSCSEVVKSIIRKVKNDSSATEVYKESLIFYRDNIKTL